jgi:uncharacterized glyoxalase superfamily protein PhnB
MAQLDRRRGDRQTLRLRSIEPLFTVSDLHKSIRFYTDVLGFVVHERYTDEDGTLNGVMLKAGSCLLGLSQDDWKKGRDRQRGLAMRLWCVSVQNVDMIARQIIAAGGTLAHPPEDETWGGRSLSIDDPDGFKLTIYQPR